jgi:hypothetical protein
MDNTFPLVALALVLAMIASLAVEIVGKGNARVPSGHPSLHHPGEWAAM